jgi:hypothetical protein
MKAAPHENFCDALVAQRGLRHNNRCPKRKEWRKSAAPLISSSGAPVAQLRTFSLPEHLRNSANNVRSCSPCSPHDAERKLRIKALGEEVIAELARALADCIDNLEEANYNCSTT